MLLLVTLLSVSLLPVSGDLQDLINNRMYSCIRDIAFCRRHSPNLRNNIWNFAFSHLYTGLYKDTLPKPDISLVGRKDEEEEKEDKEEDKKDEDGDKKEESEKQVHFSN